ncbi:twin-arginine translocation signal domain-containing protein [Sinorhizobium numidicum]|uniref:twin-arginine translocation signal domain-containing protein n=1 Tax=Sinorhizobium numidicum TaxID=680248 RepID=UPI003CC8A3E0
MCPSDNRCKRNRGRTVSSRRSFLRGLGSGTSAAWSGLTSHPFPGPMARVEE